MNKVNQLKIKYLTPSKTIETLKLSNKNKSKICYIYNYKGNCFRYFENIISLNKFFNSKKETKILFNNENKLDDFLLTQNI